jgi:ubiquinone/menaquinone biosynthesis C-methylase UbiE
VPNPGACLDYGCGLGDITYHLSKTCSQITGVDVTPDRVEWATNEYHPIPFAVCDSTSLSFPDQSFDMVSSIVVLNWAENQIGYVQNCHRVLKPGGHLLIVVKNVDPIRDFFRALIGKPSYRAKKTPISDISPAEMRNMLISTGFDVVAEDCYYDPFKDTIKNFGDIILEITKLPMRLLSRNHNANYIGFVAKRR